MEMTEKYKKLIQVCDVPSGVRRADVPPLPSFIVSGIAQKYSYDVYVNAADAIRVIPLDTMLWHNSYSRSFIRIAITQYIKDSI